MRFQTNDYVMRLSTQLNSYVFNKTTFQVIIRLKHAILRHKREIPKCILYFSFMSKIFAFLYFSFMPYVACVSLIIIWKVETCRFIKHLKTWSCRKFPYVNKHLLLRSVGRNVQTNDAELISRHYFTQYYQHRRRKLIKLVRRRRFNVGIFIINS